jgi:hypothetical protein
MFTLQYLLLALPFNNSYYTTNRTGTSTPFKPRDSEFRTHTPQHSVCGCVCVCVCGVRADNDVLQQYGVGRLHLDLTYHRVLCCPLVKADALLGCSNYRRNTNLSISLVNKLS